MPPGQKNLMLPHGYPEAPSDLGIPLGRDPLAQVQQILKSIQEIPRPRLGVLRLSREYTGCMTHWTLNYFLVAPHSVRLLLTNGFFSEHVRWGFAVAPPRLIFVGHKTDHLQTISRRTD